MTNCEEVLRDPRAPLLLAPIHMEAGTPIGLLLERVDRNVTLDGLTGASRGNGVVIRGGGCHACVVTLRSLDFSAVADAVVIDHFPGTVVIEDAKLRTAGGGTVTEASDEGQRRIFRSGGTSAVWFNASSRLVLTNVSVEASTDSVAPGLSVNGFRLSATHVRVAGHLQGLHFRGETLELRNATVVCRETGILSESAETRLRDVKVHGCADAAIQVPKGELHVDGLDAAHNLIGVALDAVARLRLSNFSLLDNRYGLVAVSTWEGQEEARFRHGVVARNAFVGIRSHWGTLDVENVTFVDNGRSAPDPSQPWLEPTSYGGLASSPAPGHSDVRVKASCFRGNLPYGMSHSLLSQADAAGNSWGDPNGPRLRPSRASVIALGPGSGDAVSESVGAWPFVYAPCSA